MNELSIILNLFLLVAFIIDRVYRIRAIKEYKEAKEAQIASLLQQLASERSGNDLQLTEMHKKRYENLKLIFDETELAKNGMIDELLVELNRLELANHRLENERKFFTKFT